MKHFFLFILISGLWFDSFGQTIEKTKAIDSLAFKIVAIKENYGQWITNDSSFFDYRMDSIKRELLMVRYWIIQKDTLFVDYYFNNNYLIKVHTYKRKNLRNVSIGQYYYENNKLFFKKGVNIKLSYGSFKKMKINPKNINRQFEMFYYNFEYYILFNRKPYQNPPALLKAQRDKMEKQFGIQ